jgi:hypothetical protein
MRRPYEMAAPFVVEARHASPTKSQRLVVGARHASPLLRYGATVHAPYGNDAYKSKLNCGVCGLGAQNKFVASGLRRSLLRP